MKIDFRINFYDLRLLLFFFYRFIWKNAICFTVNQRKKHPFDSEFIVSSDNAQKQPFSFLHASELIFNYLR